MGNACFAKIAVETDLGCQLLYMYTQSKISVWFALAKFANVVVCAGAFRNQNYNWACAQSTN